MPNGPWGSSSTPASITPTFIDIVGGASPTWGSIGGTLSAQGDLVAALALKAPLASPTFTGTVSGITASMVGALASGGTAADSSKLGGQLPAYYYQASNPSGFISGITSGNVTTALGYTPVNKAGDTMTGALSLTNANINMSNAYWLTAKNNAGSSWIGLIGRNTADKVSIDPDGYSSVFGGAVGMGALTATTGNFSGDVAGNRFFATSGNFSLDSYGSNGVWINRYAGTGGVIFSNGAGANVASISSVGALTATSGLIQASTASSAIQRFYSTYSNANTRNWMVSASSQSYGDFVIRRSTALGGDPETAGAAVLSFDYLGAATFASSVSMGALTATLGVFNAAGGGNSASVLHNTPGAYIGVGNYTAGIAKIAQCDASGNWLSVSPAMELYLGYNNNLVLHTGNVGTNAATLQAAVASATAPKVGTYAQMIAWTVAAGTTPYWYATDVTETDGLLGKLYQWSGSAWVAVGTPSTIVGRVTAGVISAGAVGAQAIAADVALIGQVLRSTGFTAGSSSVAPSGFKFSGTAFTASLLDGTTISAFGEIGGDVSIGGSKAAVIANRVKGNLFFRNTVGTTDVFIPDGIVSIEVTLQATGGAGAASYGTGGGGGQYIKAQVTVKPHNTYRLTLGASGSVSSFTWVSFDGASGFTTDSSAVNFSAAAGAAGTAGSGSGAAGADVGFSFPGPESSWNITGSAAGDGLPAGAIAQAGRGGNIYGLGSGGNGGGTTGTKAGGGGGGASATGNGGVGGIQPANGSAGTSGGGGGGGAAGGAGGVGFVRAKW